MPENDAYVYGLAVVVAVALAGCGGSVQPDDVCAAHGGIDRYVTDPVHPDGWITGIACRDGTYLGRRR